KKGVQFVLEDQPYEVLEYAFLRMQQRKPVAKTKILNLLNGKIVERNFHQNETFEEAEIDKEPIKYIYNHRDEYWFTAKNDPAKRFSLTETLLGSKAKFLKPNSEVVAFKFGDKIMKIDIPIKMDLKIKETQPGIKGDTAQGGSKPAILETGAKVTVPLFVNIGDTVRINTETGDYVERVEKSKE
ncbi:MAG: elongation factor P, partial [Patescibacteria group bacterium]